VEYLKIVLEDFRKTAKLIGIALIPLSALLLATAGMVRVTRANDTATATPSLTPLGGERVMATSIPLPTATPTLEPTPESEPELQEAEVWSPDYDKGQIYQMQCIGVNGIMHPLHHELASEKVTFFPDYETAQVVASCNYADYGVNQPQAIVLHYTDYGTLGGVVSWFRKIDGLSAHYLIDREGVVYQFVPEVVGARHVACAGTSCVSSCPAYLCADGYPELKSIGIELLNYGYVDPVDTNGTVAIYEDYLASFGRRYWEDYSEMQLVQLKALVCDIAHRWNIPIDPDHVLGHYRINQKVDPGPALNLFWERLGLPAREPIFARGCN